MLMIAKEPAANGSYPPLQPWAGQTPPEGYYQIKEGLDTSVFAACSGFVILTVIRGIVTAMDPNTEALEAWRAAASAAALPALRANSSWPTTCWPTLCSGPTASIMPSPPKNSSS